MIAQIACNFEDSRTGSQKNSLMVTYQACSDATDASFFVCLFVLALEDRQLGGSLFHRDHAAMDALRLALGGEGFQVAPCGRLADGELCHNFGDTQSSLLRKQEKDLLLTLGSGDEISHKQSKSLTNNHSTFFR